MNLSIELAQKVDELAQLILAKHPRIPTLLQEIHKTLRAYPENVTLLEEDQIAIIVSGLKIQTATEFSSAVIKKGSAQTATVNKIKTMSVDDF